MLAKLLPLHEALHADIEPRSWHKMRTSWEMFRLLQVGMVNSVSRSSEYRERTGSEA